MVTIQPFSRAVSKPLSESHPKQPSGATPPGVHFSGVGKKVGIGAAILAAVTGGTFPFIHDANKPGQHSMRSHPSSGIDYDHVQGPGFVFAPPWVKNIAVNTVNQTATERIKVKGAGGVNLDLFEVNINFRIKPEKLADVYKQFIAGKKPTQSDTTTFYNKDDASQVLYTEVIRPKLNAAVNALTPNFREESFHHSRIQLEEWMEKGFEGEISGKAVKTPSMKEFIEGLGCEYGFLKLGELSLPSNIEPTLVTNAQIPLNTKIAKLETALNEAKRAAEEENTRIGAIKAKTEAEGTAAVNTEEARGKFEVAKIEAQIKELKAKMEALKSKVTQEQSAESQYWEKFGEAESNRIISEAMRDASEIRAKADAESARLIGDAKSAVLEAEGKPLKEYKGLLAEIQMKLQVESTKSLRGADIRIIDPKSVDIKVFSGLSSDSKDPFGIAPHVKKEAVADEVLGRNKTPDKKDK